MVIDLASASGLMVALLPEAVLTLWGTVLLLVVGWRHRDHADQNMIGQLTLAGLVITLLILWGMWWSDARADQPVAMLAVDGFRFASGTVFLLGAIMAVGLSLGYLGREKLLAPEYYVLMIFATVGALFMGGGADLIVIFVGLELMSISVYVLAGINRRSAFSAESALKYFLVGAFASGFLLYGIALVYGASGQTNLSLVSARITEYGLQSNVMLMAGIGLLLIGFGFKIAAVPFHMWAPDVYDGAPTPVTAYMATAVKAAAFAALVRVLFQGLGGSAEVWSAAVWWLAVVTMLVGNVVALAQTQLKRMLAYSSVAHAGYLLAAVASGTELAATALLFYLVAYTVMTAGAFGVLAAVGRDGERDVRIDDLSGLGARRPWVALAMAVFMLSLLGFPGTAGFIGKWMILSSIVNNAQLALAVILVVATVVSAGYYLPVIMMMYMKPPSNVDAHEGVSIRGPARVIVAAAAIVLLLFGVWPNRALDAARRGVDGLRAQATQILTD